jgi:uncharacterized membrane protein YjjP (DUF1212 family)
MQNIEQPLDVESDQMKARIDSNGQFSSQSLVTPKDGPSGRHHSTGTSERTSTTKYNWRNYAPSLKSPVKFFRWLMVGGAAFAQKQSDEELVEGLSDLARCIVLLRAYLDVYGMPDKGGIEDQSTVLHEVVGDLYRGGAPLWALEPVMQKVTEGLTGQSIVEWTCLPRNALCSFSGRTVMFGYTRGFDMSRLDAMEKVSSRLASFASNTHSVSSVPTRFPNPKELNTIAPSESTTSSSSMESSIASPELNSVRQRLVQDFESADALGAEILGIASKSQGLFYFVNSKSYLKTTTSKEVDNFWNVSEQERELFSRLAAIEAKEMIQEIDEKINVVLYPSWLSILCRVVSGAGAAGIWFNGSWYDCLVAGALAAVIAIIGQSDFLSRQEKIVYEVVASCVVGIASGLIVLTWPKETCFEAMALSGVLDILQGFRIVYAVIEVMSRHTLSGSADLIEGVIFTGLIAFSLRSGLMAARAILHARDDTDSAGTCDAGVDKLWYFLLVPAASLSWSALFNPNYRDLLPMAFHGSLAFAINYGLEKAGVASNVNLFCAATAVTFSAGALSRFTGRQAVGNTVAGIYVLVPGAYLAQSLMSGIETLDAFGEVGVRGIIIGLGCWTGSIFCSPTVLGTTRTLLFQSSNRYAAASSMGRASTPLGRRNEVRQPFTMLSF